MVIAVYLVIDGHAIPALLSPVSLFVVERRYVPIQFDRLEQNFVIARPLHSENQVIPLAANRPARNTGLDPVLVYVVPDVPLMTAFDTAFVAPDETLAGHELVKIKFESFRDFPDCSHKTTRHRQNCAVRE